MVKVTGNYKITWEIPDKDVPDNISKEWEDEDWSDDEILGYFQDKGKKVKSEMVFDFLGNAVEWD